MTTSDQLDNDEVVDNKSLLAMELWVKWKNSPEAQTAIPKKLIVDIMCELVPTQAINIRSGTGKFQESL